MIIDTHAHIDTEAFEEDLQEVINRAKSSGVERIIIPAIKPSTFDSLLNIVEKYEVLYFGIGVHPHSSQDFNEEVLNRVKMLAQHKKCVAIGEIGLDYYYNDLAPKKAQIECFRSHLKLAKELDLPVIIHNRDSEEDLIRILTEEKTDNLRGVLHCFPADINLLDRALTLDFNVSFTGNITFKKSEHYDTIKAVPLERFMIETDSPYMAPVPFRGKRNEPSYVLKVAEKIAEIKNMKLEEILNASTNNAKQLFKIMMMILSFIMISNISYSQDYDDDYYYDNEEEEEYDLIHPFPKNWGLGFFAGSNTIVDIERFTEDDLVKERTRSLEGIFAYGGNINYGGLSDYLILQFTYVYSQNTKLLEQFPLVNPNIHQMFEFTSMWTPNPYSRLNVYAMLGPTFFMNSYGQWDEENESTFSIKNNKFGINTGLGFNVNIPIKGAGLLVVNAEWRLNFAFGSENRNQPIRRSDGTVTEENVDFTSYYSIPRFGLIFYPEF